PQTRMAASHTLYGGKLEACQSSSTCHVATHFYMVLCQGRRIARACISSFLRAGGFQKADRSCRQGSRQGTWLATPRTARKVACSRPLFDTIFHHCNLEVSLHLAGAKVRTDPQA